MKTSLLFLNFISGKDFLVLYFSVILLAWIGLYLFRYLISHSSERQKVDAKNLLPASLIGYLNYGILGAVQASLAELLNQKVLKKDAVTHKIYPNRDVMRAIYDKKRPLHESIYQEFRETKSFVEAWQSADFRKKMTDFEPFFQEQLIQEGLLVKPSFHTYYKVLRYVLFFSLFAVGISRFVGGLNNDKPVLYLGLMLLWVFLLFLYKKNFPKMTSKGKKYLEDLKSTYKNISKNSYDFKQSEQAAFLTAIFGASVLESSELMGIGIAYKQNYASNSSTLPQADSCSIACSSDNGSSCSSSSDSSSSCSSSSCGGGGCGGCGS